jgi:DNA topoisomerase-6 subunit B
MKAKALSSIKKPLGKTASKAIEKRRARSKEASADLGSDHEQATARAVIEKVRKSAQKITTSSTAEYFAKNLQQVGFSSPTKAVLTTVKEALDNALDACEDAGILPEVKLKVQKIGSGTLKNTDQILIRVEDNGPGIDPEDVPKVFGEYLASSKFGRGRCSRGQQGIGISAATTWAMQTTASGARVKTRKKGAKKAFACVVDMDLKNNKGMVKDKQTLDWDVPHGTVVEFLLDGRIQLNGEAGLLNYIRGTVLLNPHMTLVYDITDVQPAVIDRVSNELPAVPPATEPHPHTMKLGEFISHARLYGRMKCSSWLKKGFSRINEATLRAMVSDQKLPEAILNKNIDSLSEDHFKTLFAALQNIKLMAPATTSVLSVGEDALALSVRRLGDIDFFAVLTRKPTICDFKPVQVEVAIARLKERGGGDMEEAVQVLRFANRVPLQFDKAACAIVKAITSVNWRAYGLKQPKNALPLGPYIIAVSVVSPFIKFKNASKETIDGSDELVEELRRALMQTGQRLSRYLAREHKAGELEQRVQHIEQFGPVLIEALARILDAPEIRKERAFNGLAKILEKDTKGIAQDLAAAEGRLASYLEEKRQRLGAFFDELEQVSSNGSDNEKPDNLDDNPKTNLVDETAEGKKPDNKTVTLPSTKTRSEQKKKRRQ